MPCVLLSHCLEHLCHEFCLAYKDPAREGDGQRLGVLHLYRADSVVDRHSDYRPARGRQTVGYRSGLVVAQLRLVLHGGHRRLPGVCGGPGVFLVRQTQTGQQGRHPGFQLRRLGGDAVLVGYRYFAAVLRRIRAIGSLLQSAGRRIGYQHGRASGGATDLPALGPARLGDLRTGRSGRGVLCLPA
ncbi:hypothetical protein D3C72_1431780 [compost metagenome]